MNGRVAKALRKATNDKEVKGTPQWRVVYQQAKKEYKKYRSKNA